MIHKQQMMESMLEACPSFQSAWDDFCREWQEEANDLPLYLALGDLARHLIGMLSRGDTESFHSVFNVVENWHREGDSYVKEAATVGLLEDLQNTGLHTSTEPEQFCPYLGEESQKWWDKLTAFWDGRGSLTRD